MNIPFSVEDFMNVFRLYNTSFRFMPPVMYVLGFVSIGFLFSRGAGSNRIISGILAFFWLWMGAVYHIGYFSSINAASILFGLLFIVQGFVIFLYGSVAGRLDFHAVGSGKSAVALVFIVYALIVYPILGNMLGHAYPASPVFGMAPCPTTIFTFGMLLFSKRRVPFYVYLIPFFWAIVGLSAAVNLRVYEDFGLTIAGVVGTVMIVSRNRRLKNIVAGGIK